MTIVDTPERRQLRELTRAFVSREVLPHLADWERAGEVPRELHATAAKFGLLGIGFPESVGGSGGDLLDSIIVTEEIIRSGGSSGLVAALFTHGIALPHMVAAAGGRLGGTLGGRLGGPESTDDDLIDRYVRPTLAGSMIGALAITEPDTGSDVASIRTHARRDGDHYVVNGAKTYITSGVRADFVTTAVRTGQPGDGALSLLVIDKGTPGFTVGRRLE
ncbi:acyl-CoA dehydrogenase family protein, partial [Micromonospora sp. NPDC051296]|uniref:acyl-CoA dehydrogenase family protein n=1 Tax=Micromonospora sp. NPDC051296 TaxID=3155046 RepID=UPI00343F8E84